MPIRCVAIDHEPLSLELLQYYVSLHPDLQLLATFEELEPAKNYLQAHKTDLLIVDINTPGYAGTEFISTLSNRPQLILTSSYTKHPSCTSTQLAVDMLIKPIGPERFSAAIQKLQVQANKKSTEKLSGEIEVRSNYQRLSIALQHIQYIEAREDYICIHVDNARPILTLMSLKAMEEQLPDAEFIRIHRSYIVPVQRIKAIHAKHVELPETRLPIGKKYAPAVVQLQQKA